MAPSWEAKGYLSLTQTVNRPSGLTKTELRRPLPHTCPPQQKADVHLWGWPWGRICWEARGLAAYILQAEAKALKETAG